MKAIRASSWRTFEIRTVTVASGCGGGSMADGVRPGGIGDRRVIPPDRGEIVVPDVEGDIPLDDHDVGQAPVEGFGWDVG